MELSEQLRLRLAENIALVKKGAENHDDSFILRALRRTTWFRKQGSGWKALMVKYLPDSSPVKASIEEILPDDMEVEALPADSKETAEVFPPEVELYLLHTAIHIAKTHKTCSREVLLKNARLMVSTFKDHQRRSMDVLNARAWHTFALIAEEKGMLEPSLRDEILEAHRLACIRLDEVGQAVAINLILRDYVSRNMVSEAVKFASKARFPDSASNNMQVRNLYYLGRVEALQLEYGKALNLIQQALRKSPTTCGKGFRLKLHELATVVTLLTGETPERAWFSDQEFGEALTPYFDLVKAVRVGNVQSFEACQKLYSARFENDGTLTLVQRLHSSVIKTGLKAIGASYSRVSFPDIAQKLELDSEENVKETPFYLCAKAIRDGVLDATIDPDGLYLCSSDLVDIYSSTSDPQRAYQRRINFLMQVHNDAVKSLRFPPDAHKTTNKPAPQTPEETDLDDLEDNLVDED